MKITLGLSGGVDSAVAGLLLQQQGYDVSAVFMQNWEADQDDPYCTAEQDLSDAKACADTLHIPLQAVNFAKEYWDRVFQHCLDEFTKGRTPNPDILCNSEIKFKTFLDFAQAQGAEKIATGHYCRKKTLPNGQAQLLKGLDNTKDQSYFLYAISQSALQKAEFPIGEFPKTQVRELAKQAGFITHNKKDSTGICFIGERNFKEFLNEFILAQPGLIKNEAGDTVGKHDGTMFYTLGQRKGLNIGGQKGGDGSAFYLIDKDIENNILIVGQGYDHPRLYKPSLTCNEMNWFAGNPPAEQFKCMAKTRYHQVEQACTVTQKEDDLFLVEFDEKQRAITPGQSVVFYQGDVCLGGGIIL